MPSTGTQARSARAAPALPAPDPHSTCVRRYRFAFTGGFELALGCDILIAADTAQFADTHCKFGIHPSWGLSQKLPRIIGPGRARVMSFTAKPIDAATAERWGLVTAVTKPELLMQKAFKVGTATSSWHVCGMSTLAHVCGAPQGHTRDFRVVPLVRVAGERDHAQPSAPCAQVQAAVA